MESDHPAQNTQLSEMLSARPNAERYRRYMDSSMGDKLSHILPYIEHGSGNLQVLSIGAGSGKFERAIAGLLPGVHIIGLDASVPMLEEIAHQNNNHIEAKYGFVSPLLASAEAIPLRDESVDVIIASSVIHEIASYQKNYQFGEGLEKFFIEAMRVLKKGGKLVIRDFMQPNDPDGFVHLRIGEIKEGDCMDPTEFMEKFVSEFHGDDLSYVSSQIEALKQNGKWGKGAYLKVTNAHVFEMLAHFSWSQSFNEEVREKYAYLPVKDYVGFIQKALGKVSVESSVLEVSTYLQDGYQEHIQGRLDLVDQDGNETELPDFTGIIVLQKGETK